jgi:uncharacterized membrane protein
MTFYVCNHYPATVSVAVGFSSDGSGDFNNCSGNGGFQKIGWFNIDPLQCQWIVNDDCEDVGQYWLYYATATDGAVWAGDFCTGVTNQAFNWCWNEPGIYNVCFRLLDVNSYDDFTLNLVP